MKREKPSGCTTKIKDGFGPDLNSSIQTMVRSHTYSIIPKLKPIVLGCTCMNPEIFIHMKLMRLFQKPNNQQIITKKTCISEIFVKL